MRGKRLEIFVLVVFIAVMSYMIIAPFPAGTTTLQSPATGTNTSGTITLNATIGGLTTQNASNVSFYFKRGNDTNDWVLIGTNASVNRTEYIFVWDTTAAGVTEGNNFTINATATFVLNNTDPANYSTSTTINVTIDNTGPVTILNTPTGGDQSNSTLITFNFTVNDNVFATIARCNLTLDPLNASRGSDINRTTNIPNGTTVAFINTIPSGGHTWNVTCQDNAGSNNLNSSLLGSFYVGSLFPSVTIKTVDKNKKTKTTFDASETVTISCTRSDDDGWNATTIDIKLPSQNSYGSLRTVDESASKNSSETLELDFSSTLELGDYIVRCIVTDRYGNTNNTNTTFTIQKKVNTGTSPFANKNFQAPVAKIKIGTGTISEVGKLSSTSTNRLMQQGAQINFNVEGEDHSLKVKELSDSKITVTISSEPFDVTINKGESKKVDINQDGKNDIQVTFYKKFDRHADIAVELLTSDEVINKGEDQKKIIEEIINEKEEVNKKGNLFVVGIVILVIIGIGIILVKNKKR